MYAAHAAHSFRDSRRASVSAKVKQELAELTQQLKSMTQRVAAVSTQSVTLAQAADRYDHAVREGA